jgi:hypothetical protein
MVAVGEVKSEALYWLTSIGEIVNIDGVNIRLSVILCRFATIVTRACVNMALRL